MRKFCKSRGIIPSQESAVEKPLKCSSWPSEKSLVCSETCCLKNEQKKKQQQQTDNIINFVLLGATFLFFRFPSVFCALLYNAILWEIVHVPCPNTA